MPLTLLFLVPLAESSRERPPFCDFFFKPRQSSKSGTCRAYAWLIELCAGSASPPASSAVIFTMPLCPVRKLGDLFDPLPLNLISTMLVQMSSEFVIGKVGCTHTVQPKTQMEAPMILIAMTCVATLFLVIFGTLWHQTLMLARRDHLAKLR